MNKTNQKLNLVLRVGIIATWIASIASIFALLSGIKGIDTTNLNKDNAGERLIGIIGNFAAKTTLYYVTIGMLAVCLILAVITRYKTRLAAYIGKIAALGIMLMTMIGGLDYIQAIRACKGVSDLTVTGTDASSIASALSAAGIGSNAESIAQTLTNQEAAGSLFMGYILPVFVLFVLAITSIHCLVKRTDPNNADAEAVPAA